MSNQKKQKKITKEKLLKLRALLAEKCEFVDYGTISCTIPPKKIQQLKDENLALANIEDAFYKAEEGLVQEGIEFDELEVDLMFYLCFSHRKERHFYRSKELGDTVLVNVCDYSYKKDGEETSEKHKMPQTYPLIPVSFEQMANLLNEHGYTIDFESFDDLVHAFAKDLPMCTRIKKSYKDQKTDNYQKIKKNA